MHSSGSQSARLTIRRPHPPGRRRGSDDRLPPVIRPEMTSGLGNTMRFQHAQAFSASIESNAKIKWLNNALMQMTAERNSLKLELNAARKNTNIYSADEYDQVDCENAQMRSIIKSTKSKNVILQQKAEELAVSVEVYTQRSTALDILAEERRLQLDKQEVELTRFRMLLETLRKENHTLSSQHKVSLKDIKEARRTLSEVSAELDKYTTKSQQLTVKLTATEKVRGEIAEELDEKRARVISLSSEVEILREESETNQVLVLGLESKADRLATELDDLKRVVQSLSQELSTTNQNLKKKTKLFEDLKENHKINMGLKRVAEASVLRMSSELAQSTAIIEGFKTDLHEALEAKAQLEEELAATQHALKESRSKAEVLTAAKAELEKELDVAKELITSLQTELQSIKTTLEEQRLELATANDTLEELREQVTGLENQVAGLEKDLTKMTKKFKMAEERLEIRKARINELENSLDTMKRTHQQESKDMRGTISGLEKDIASFMLQKRKAERATQELQKELNSVSKLLERRVEEIHTMNVHIRDMERTIETHKDIVESLQRQIKELRMECSQLQRKADEGAVLREKLAITEDKLDEADSRLTMKNVQLKEMEKQVDSMAKERDDMGVRRDEVEAKLTEQVQVYEHKLLEAEEKVDKAQYLQSHAEHKRKESIYVLEDTRNESVRQIRDLREHRVKLLATNTLLRAAIDKAGINLDKKRPRRKFRKTSIGSQSEIEMKSSEADEESVNKPYVPSEMDKEIMKDLEKHGKGEDVLYNLQNMNTRTEEEDERSLMSNTPVHPRPESAALDLDEVSKHSIDQQGVFNALKDENTKLRKEMNKLRKTVRNVNKLTSDNEALVTELKFVTIQKDEYIDQLTKFRAREVVAAFWRNEEEQARLDALQKQKEEERQARLAEEKAEQERLAAASLHFHPPGMKKEGTDQPSEPEEVPEGSEAEAEAAASKDPVEAPATEAEQTDTDIAGKDSNEELADAAIEKSDHPIEVVGTISQADTNVAATSAVPVQEPTGSEAQVTTVSKIGDEVTGLELESNEKVSSPDSDSDHEKRAEIDALSTQPAVMTQDNSELH